MEVRIFACSDYEEAPTHKVPIRSTSGDCNVRGPTVDSVVAIGVDGIITSHIENTGTELC